MGQRHQVYLRLPAVNYGKDNPNTRGPVVVGIHHQWLFGVTALASLVRFLRFWENADDWVFSDECNALGALAACYSIDPETGYYHDVQKLDSDEILDIGENGNNNNGVTLIDISGKTPKYCFLSIHHLEGLDSEWSFENDDGEIETIEDEVEKHGYYQPINARTWEDWHYRAQAYNGPFKPRACVNFLKDVSFMRIQDCKAMFPEIAHRFLTKKERAEGLDPLTVKPPKAAPKPQKSKAKAAKPAPKAKALPAPKPAQNKPKSPTKAVSKPAKPKAKTEPKKAAKSKTNILDLASKLASKPVPAKTKAKQEPTVFKKGDRIKIIGDSILSDCMGISEPTGAIFSFKTGKESGTYEEIAGFSCDQTKSVECFDNGRVERI